MTDKINSLTDTRLDLRERAAQAVLDYLQTCLQPTAIIGIGTGATTEIFIQLLASRHLLFSHCVASSLRSARALERVNLPQQPLASCFSVDFYIDGIDEGLPNGITIKGGGGALAREKILATMAKIFITMADKQRRVRQLGKFLLPIEILPVAQKTIIRQLISMGGVPHLREGFTTDNGNIILDVAGLDLSAPHLLETQLNCMAGIVENGIFARRQANFMVFSDDKEVEWLSVDGT